ncbi:unnamed protein product [Rhizopus stolonifer]
MSSGFRKPVKRIRQLIQRNNDEREPQVTSVEDLLKKKKTKIERENTLGSLFQELEQERDYQEKSDIYSYAQKKQPAKSLPETKIPFDDSYLLESDTEDIEESELKETAKNCLQPEEQETLDHIFQGTKEVKEVHRLETGWRRTFFKPGIKCIREPCLMTIESTQNKKEMCLSKISESNNKIVYQLIMTSRYHF